MYSNILSSDKMLFLLSKGGREEGAGGVRMVCVLMEVPHMDPLVCVQ